MGLVFERMDVQVRVLSGQLETIENLFAWLNHRDCITLSPSLMRNIITLRLVIFMSLVHEIMDRNQAINWRFLRSITNLTTLIVQIQTDSPSRRSFQDS